MIRLTLLLLALPTLALAETACPRPITTGSPPIPNGWRRSSNSTAISVLRSSPVPGWA